eukprot:8646504-Pyramimonas_sp.AAC.1
MSADEDRTRAAHPLPPRYRRANVLIDVARALAYLHRPLKDKKDCVVHRDVKPANILMEGETLLRARLGDFGLGRSPKPEELQAMEMMTVVKGTRYVRSASLSGSGRAGQSGPQERGAHV